MKDRINNKTFAIILIAILVVNNLIMQVFVYPRLEEKTHAAEETVMDEASEDELDEAGEASFEEVTEEEVTDVVSEEETAEGDEADVAEEEDTSYFFEENEEVSEEDVVGGALEAEGWSNYRSRYADLKCGDEVDVICWTRYGDDNFGRTEDPSLFKPFGGYDEATDAWYGLMSIPAYDNTDSWASYGKAHPSAIVRIPGIKDVVEGQYYKGTFIMDVARTLGYSEDPDPAYVDVIDGRVWIEPRYGVGSWFNESSDSRIYDSIGFILLYSMDVSGNDIKLHLRLMSTSAASTIKMPDELTQGATLKHENGQWYFVTTMSNGPDPMNPWYNIVTPVGDRLKISDDDIGGLLSPSDPVLYGKVLELEDPYVYEYLKQWGYDNGFRKWVDIPSVKEAKEIQDNYGDGYLDKYFKREKTVSSNLVIVPKTPTDITGYFSEISGKVKYISSDKKCASVKYSKKTGKVLVTGKKAGKVKITRRYVDSASKKWEDGESVELTVYKPTVKVSTKNPMAVRLDYDKVYDMSQYVENTSDVKATYSAKGGAISMNPDGTFKVLGEGKATVVIAFGKYKVKAKVVVTP